MPDSPFFIETRPSQQEIADFAITPEQWNAALEYYASHKNELVQAAAFSRDNAVSYRPKPFRVGAAVMGIEPGLAEGEYAIYQGHNFKPVEANERGRDKRCAERSALEAAQAWAKAAAAIVTVSKEVATGDPSKGHDALHPCLECRTMFRQLREQGFLKDDTIVANANDGGDSIVLEERKLKDLLDLYSDDSVE